jgi:hypothetical protein
MLELSQNRNVTPAPARKGSQPRKLMIALALLLVALVAILIKDRQFWFGSEEAVIESDLPAAQPTAATSAHSLLPRALLPLRRPPRLTPPRLPLLPPKLRPSL